jgi:hypothetical protein
MDNEEIHNENESVKSDNQATSHKPDIRALLSQKVGRTPSEWSKNLDDIMKSKGLKIAKEIARMQVEAVLKSEKVQDVRSNGIEAVDKGMRKVFGFPTRSDELNNLGMTEYKAGRYMSALAYFKDALMRNPDSVRAKENIDMTLLEIKGMAAKTLTTLDHEAAKTITEIAVLEEQVSSLRDNLELMTDMIKTKREYLQSLTDKYNKINEETEKAIIKSENFEW